MVIQLDNGVRYKTTRENGHCYVDILIVCEGSTDTSFIQFMYDTGAWLTVLSRKEYEANELFSLPWRNFAMGGYGASADKKRKVQGILYQIPALKIGRRLLTKVWAFTPADYKITENILGLNAVDYYNTYQDNGNDYFYFFDNPNPRPYIHESGFSLACEGSFSFEKGGFPRFLNTQE